MNILFIENHGIFASNVIRQFMSQHSVTVVPSLSAARQALEHHTFDLLLIDYDLDDGKGDVLVTEIKSSGRPIAIIGVSAHDEGNRALLRAGAIAVCSKMQFDRIQQVIESVTEQVKEPGPSPNNLLWWVVPGVLAGMPMPFLHVERRLNPGQVLTAFDDDLPVLHAAGIRAVVSLLNIPTDTPVYEAAGFIFLCLPVPDGAAPTLEKAREFIQFVTEQRANNRPVAVHCEAGMGRTGTLLAAYLISQGVSAERAIQRIRGVEQVAIETPQQIQFLKEFEKGQNNV